MPPQIHKNKNVTDKNLNIFLENHCLNIFYPGKGFTRAWYLLTMGQQVPPLVGRLREFTLEELVLKNSDSQNLTLEY